EGVEIVERADRREGHAPALGRARIHVREVGKARAVLEITVNRQPVSRARRRRRTRPGGSGGGGQGHGEDNGERSHARQPSYSTRRWKGGSSAAAWLERNVELAVLLPERIPLEPLFGVADRSTGLEVELPRVLQTREHAA